MGVTDKLIFGGVDSSTYGVYLTGSGTFGAPERDVEYVSVPGRNGDLIIDNGKWNNIEVTYPANIPSGFDSSFASFRAAVCRKRGYQRLEDTYHPDEYRMAAFTSGFDPELTPGNHGGEFDIVFNCKPQRFLKSGEVPIQMIPVITEGPSQYHSPYIPRGGNLELKVHCPENKTLTVDLITYNSSKTQTGSTSYSVQNNSTVNATISSTVAYWRLNVSGVYNIIDQVILDVKTKTVIDGKTVDLDAKFARKITITNPTGYPTKPLIEVNAPALNMTIDNYINGVAEEYYQFNVLDTGKTRFWMDCDTQYLYDDAGNNLTNYLRITTSQSAVGKALVFPELGEDTIEVSAYYASNYEIGIVNLYPRWWTL